MRLRDIKLPPVFNAAGARGFFGEGYPVDRLWGPFMANFLGSGFIAKTTTLLSNVGNMPLRDDGITPKQLFPRCVYVNFFKGIMLNAVGLSGPGAEFLLCDGRWQKREEPFFISFSPIGKTFDERLDEIGRFVSLLRWYLSNFKTTVCLEINVSCPNIGHDPNERVYEAPFYMEITGALDLPQQYKFNALVSPQLLTEVCRNEVCDAVVLSNTIPWRALPEFIGWRQLFGDITKSPLARRGFSDGGLSGWPLLPAVCASIRELRRCGFKKPVWACGGIDSVEAVEKVVATGANGVQIASVKSLRPWRVPGIIKRAYELFK